MKGGTGLMSSRDRLAKLSSAANFPKTAAAVRELTNQGRNTMLGALTGKYVHWAGGTFKVNRISGALFGAVLGGARYPYEGNPLAGAVVVNHPHWRFIRDGVKPYDMKPGLLNGPHSKVSKYGNRYAVVPIRVDPNRATSAVVYRIVTSRSKGWNFPGTLPRRVDRYAREVMAPICARRLARAMREDLGL
jgi:hypothetical protein